MAHHANACHQTKHYSLCGSSGCTSHKVLWRVSRSFAHTMYMASQLMAAWVIQVAQLHTHPGVPTRLKTL